MSKAKVNFIVQIVIVVAIVVYIFTRPYDPTDDAKNGDRSGFVFYKDHGTGCHYIAGGYGFFGKAPIIPRVDKNGKHICEDK